MRGVLVGRRKLPQVSGANPSFTWKLKWSRPLAEQNIMLDSECLLMRHSDAAALAMAVPGAMAADPPRPPHSHGALALRVTPPEHEDYLRDIAHLQQVMAPIGPVP